MNVSGDLIAVFRCDHDGCDRYLEVPEGQVGSVAAALGSISSIGWRRIDGRDYCPWHVPKKETP